MTRRNLKAILWIGLAASAIVLGLPATAQASTNVVPNPGFEQGGCGDSTLCAWSLVDQPGAFMEQDTTNPYTGSASMALGWSGETGGEFGGWGAEATTVCASIGPGVHPASFWYRDAWSSNGPASVDLGATFYQGADCTGAGSQDSLGAPSQAPPGEWRQVTGALTAPPDTESVSFQLSVSGSCDNYSGCSIGANFDDLEVDDAILTTPAINGFSPLDGLVGTNVDIQGVNLSGASSMTFNGTAASFTVDSDSEIHATLPSGATTGPISVTTPNGTTTSSSSFTVDAPRLDAFTPTSGAAGASVHITGAFFTGATSVKFNGTPATFTVYSDWDIFTAVPGGATTGPITVTTPTGTASSSSSFTVGPSPPPTISLFTPISGPVGTSVDIQGAGFSGTTSVRFHATAATYTVVSDSEITARVPTGAITGPISVTTPAGTATSSSTFTVTAPPPTITIFTPASGPVGTSVDIQGAGFTGATSVKFSGTLAAYTVNSDFEITAHVPTEAATGPISVTTPGGTATSLSSFTVNSPPTISSFTPTSGHVGTSVIIQGTDLSGTTNVTFNGTAATYTVNSPTKITTSVPSGAASGPVAVTTPYGTATSTGSFTVNPAPTITSFTPTQGPAGKKVTISGTNLTGAGNVQLGTISAAYSVNSPTQITATVPNIPHGNYEWSVTTPGGTAISTTYFHVP